MEMRIGVELTEWRGKEESEWVAQRDRFRDDVLHAMDHKGLVRFRCRDGAGWTALLDVIRLPNTSKRPAVIAQLLKFLCELEANPSRFKDSYGGIHVPRLELPFGLGSYFNGIGVLDFPSNNLGVVVTEMASNSCNESQNGAAVAIRAFRKRLYEKAIEGAEKYRLEKQRLGLEQLWLIIHYSSPDVFVEPIKELGLQIGYGEHRRKTQEAVAAQLKIVAQEIGGGPFDRVSFLVACQHQPDPFSADLLGA